MPKPFYTVIKDSGDHRLGPYRSLKGKELDRDGLFIAEGEKVIRSMLASGHRIASCLVAANAIARYRPLLAAMKKSRSHIYVAPKETVEEIVGFRFHQGLIAAGHCPERRSAARALRTLRHPRILVALNGVNDPQNVGLMARNAAAFGAQALIVDCATYDPYYRRAVRVSMGAIFSLTVCHEEELAPALLGLKKENGVRVIAADPGKGSVDIAKADLSAPVCLVFGNEDRGVSPDVLRAADVRVRVPIAEGVDSLNVAGASAILLHTAANLSPIVIARSPSTGSGRRSNLKAWGASR